MSFSIRNSYTASSAQIADAVVINSKLGTDISVGGGFFFLLHYGGTVGAGTWAMTDTGTNNVVIPFGNNSSHSLNDSISFTTYLSAGTWVFNLGTRNNTNQGKINFKIDGTSAGYFDCYAGSDLGGQTETITGVTVATSGLKTLTLLVDGKNGSSSDYYIFAYSLSGYRTA